MGELVEIQDPCIAPDWNGDGVPRTSVLLCTLVTKASKYSAKRYVASIQINYKYLRNSIAH